jgi:cell division septation protein DedD
LAQDDYYYEIQLTNKQLVFYFMAGAAGLILSFLAGVMVGRGVDGGAAANASDARAVAEERVVAESSPAPAAATPATLPPVPTTTLAAARPTPTPRTAPPSGPLPKALGSSAKGFAIQVGAFKDRAGADTVVKSLKGRGFPAYTVPPVGGGLFTVRVGVYRDRADAEAVQDRLRDDKFKPYIVKQ